MTENYIFLRGNLSHIYYAHGAVAWLSVHDVQEASVSEGMFREVQHSDPASQDRCRTSNDSFHHSCF